MHRQYAASRSVFSFVEIISWIAVIGGAVLAIVAFSLARQAGFGGQNNAAGMLAAMPGIAIAFIALLAVVFVQVGRAGVDTAEMTGKMLKISREQLELTRSAAQPSKLAGTTNRSQPEQLLPDGNARPEEGIGEVSSITETQSSSDDVEPATISTEASSTDVNSDPDPVVEQIPLDHQKLERSLAQSLTDVFGVDSTITQPVTAARPRGINSNLQA